MLPLCPRRTGQEVCGAWLEGELGRLPGAGPAAAEPHPARGQQRDAADLEADITDRAQAETAVQQAAGQFGRLDILVNNAGLMLLGQHTDEVDRKAGQRP